MRLPNDHRRMTYAEFLDWEERQEIKYELIDGVPAPKFGDGETLAMAASLHFDDVYEGVTFDDEAQAND